MKSLVDGRCVHAYIKKNAYDMDMFLGNQLVNMYVKCEQIEDAVQVFDEMPKRNVVSWTTILGGYVRSGRFEDGLTLFNRMRLEGKKPNHVTFAGILRASAELGNPDQGQQIHGLIVRTEYESDVLLNNALVTTYASFGYVADAWKVFDKMSERDVVSWNTMIVGYTQNGHCPEALRLYGQMQWAAVKADHATFASVLGACAGSEALQQGKGIHAHVIRNEFELENPVGNALVTMYVRCRSVESARRLFDRMPERDVVSWTNLVKGYVQSESDEEALKSFRQMQQEGIKPNDFTLTSILGGCAILRDLEWGKQVHVFVIKLECKSNVCVGNALVDMYAKCGSIEDARQVFEEMPEQDVISWTMIISGYAQYGHGEEALKCFCQIRRTGMKLDTFVFASIIRACADLASLEQGKQIHACTMKNGFASDVFVGSAFVNMYAKCGSIEDSQKLFDKMVARDLVTWNSMIVGCAQHGHDKDAMELFEHLQQAGVKPDHITFVGVLFACSHVGLLHEGCHYFDSMSREHGISPRMEHYACIVDLLGRAGHLNKAEACINNMPFKPSALVWQTLLGACRIHGNTEMGKRVADHLLELEPQDSATYVLLSNLYAAAGRWDDRTKVRKMMENMGMKKERGYSWIEVKNAVHAFGVGDTSHPQTAEIYAKLNELIRQIKEMGYSPQTNSLLHDMELEQQEYTVSHHSEKLAIAFGLISLSPMTPIRIIKNLRVCGDCHTATKFISQSSGRQIVMRDVNRFHHFKDGLCSCGDYW
jgi:pentatricopeptide repeat protein